MEQLTKLCKVVAVVETALEQQVLKQFTRLGARGYTCVYCFGRGQHPVYEDMFTGHSQVRIEIVTSRPVAESILAYMHRAEFQNRPAVAYLEEVEVYDPSHFV